MRRRGAGGWPGLLVAGLSAGMWAQQTEPPSVTLETTTRLVVVPTLVRTREGGPAFGLTAKDFRLLDNGSAQAVRVEEVEGQPIAAVVLLQVGGAAKAEFPKYRRLGTVVSAMLGDAAKQVALVTFDSQPEEVWNFPPRREGMEGAFAAPEPGDDGAAILDAVNYAMELLATQAAGSRKLILLLSQPQDAGSKAKAEDVVRRLGESNTAVYSVTFSPEKEWVKGQFRGDRHENKPYAFGPDHPPLLHTFDLGAPLVVAVKAMQKDVPAELSELSGGEHVRFGERNDLERKLMEMANALPNSYLLSFQPGVGTAGLHSLRVEVPGRDVTVSARGSYWLEAAGR